MKLTQRVTKHILKYVPTVNLNMVAELIRILLKLKLK